MVPTQLNEILYVWKKWLHFMFILLCTFFGRFLGSHAHSI
jgi:hypothetical protein